MARKHRQRWNFVDAMRAVAQVKLKHLAKFQVESELASDAADRFYM